MPRFHFKRKFSTKTLLSRTLALVAVAIIFLIVIHRSQIVNVVSLATTRQPERFTELYFDNSSRLPLYSAVGKTQNVSFRVANHEGRATTYHYQAAVRLSNNTSAYASGQITVADGQSASVPIAFRLDQPDASARVDVQLVGRAENISFRTRS